MRQCQGVRVLAEAGNGKPVPSSHVLYRVTIGPLVVAVAKLVRGLHSSFPRPRPPG